ncbi:MAG: larA 4, partial [Firmicutes bacterium]|nr:larA 4 [Bacillota bacterium]
GFGEKEVALTLPEEQILHIIEGKAVKAITDVPAAIKTALRNPIDSPPLQEVVKAGDKVAIIASDITRKWISYPAFLPTLLNELNGAGIPDNDITLVVSLGSHRKHTDQENIAVYGQEAVRRVQLVQSYAPNTTDFVYMGKTSRGVETYLNQHVVAADKVIMTGGIVYHSMAGFAGGRKAIMPGVAGYSTIQGNHSFCLHEVVGQGINPNCMAGKLDGNNMHADMMEMAAMLKQVFLVNAVFTPEGQFARFVAGHWHTAWLEGCQTVKDIFGVPITAKADLVIASAGGFPKDINLYQATKTTENAFMAVKDDGVIITLMECRDIMEPPDFSGWFNYESLYDREIALRKAFTVPGFIALKTGLAAKKVPHIIVTLPQNKEFIENAGLIAATTLEEALAIAEQILGRKDYTITLMPHGANTVPLLPE